MVTNIRRVLTLSLAIMMLGSALWAQVDTSSKATATTKDVVRKTQQRLQVLGYEPGPADGVMGARTTAALKKFQTDHRLSVTGVLDQKTVEALNVRPAEGAGAASAAVGKGVGPGNKASAQASGSGAKNSAAKSSTSAANGVYRKIYVTSAGDVIAFLAGGRAIELNGSFGVAYANQAIYFGADGNHPRTECTYSEDRDRVTLVCPDGQNAVYTVNRDGSLTGPPAGLWGERAFAHLTEKK
ncbi:MAG: peptidoglycan-binding domain-containing protein [Terriglobia bacterium]